ncbi:MAG: imidazole glycerol phosphate synthase subunit HisH [Thermodesulfobacteriota bacterium]
MGQRNLVIIDYGMGNLHSVNQALIKVGCPARVSSSAEDVAQAYAVVLPGVGSFGQCMKNLSQLGLIAPLTSHLEAGRPYLGICLGYQILFESSQESSGTPGLGFLSGQVVKFPSMGLKIPHMGWNVVNLKRPNPLFTGIAPKSYFYFVHSYLVEPKDEEMVVTTTEYGVNFASSVQSGNLFACQFHPEKSQRLGLKFLANFLEFAGIEKRTGRSGLEVECK